jgi:hypothetical protein
MNRRQLLIAGCAWAASPAFAQEPSTPSISELLAKLESNLNFDTRSTKLRMTITSDRRVKTLEMISYGRGLDESVIEFLEPARERGTRYLRKGDELWMYLPSIERTQKISGHMLRQGMAGSDMSYEDMTSSTDWDQQYNGAVTGQEALDGRPHWKVELTAKLPDVTYHRRVLWIDVETLIPTRQELFAVSGMLVKRWSMSDVRPLADGRKYPFKMVIEDTLRQGSSTQIETLDLQLGVALEEEVFSIRWLERK